MTFLPVAAVIAICIFCLKEVFEFIRRRAERKRKIKAIRELLHHEVAKNDRVFQNLFWALDATTRAEFEPDGSDEIVIQHGGRLYYNRLDEGGSVVTGLPLPSVQTTEFNRLLPVAAELDRHLYTEIRNGYDHIYEIEHLWTSFVNFLTGNPKDKEMWFDGFQDYAKRCYNDIDDGIREFYSSLSDKALPVKGRFPRSKTEAEQDAAANP